MAEIKILYEGYSSAEAKGHTCSTISLVTDKATDKESSGAIINIVVDPGTLPDPKILVKKLEENNLKPDQINIVFLTHSHTDHMRYAGLFTKAKILDYWGCWDGDIWKECKGKITDSISMIKTPGHSYDSVTLLVKTMIDNKSAIVAICGDVFWKKDYPETDSFASDLKELDKSRKKVLELADYVIPGHGMMFKVEK